MPMYDNHLTKEELTVKPLNGFYAYYLTIFDQNVVKIGHQSIQLNTFPNSNMEQILLFVCKKLQNLESKWWTLNHQVELKLGLALVTGILSPASS